MNYVINADNRYLCLPVNNEAGCRKIMLCEKGELLYDIDVFLAGENDEKAVWMYVDMHPFMGKEISFHIDNTEMPYVPRLSGKRNGEADYESRLRPRVHFTTRYGWINDPNGLIFLDGVYHMFYQHNPAGTRWGNMHWGHAVSKDLIHWTEKADALYPDRTGTMFSGSAVGDFGNILGLKNSGPTPILLYYTAAGGTSMLSEGAPFTQRLAYSTDGGETFVKWDEARPVLGHLAASNRDPKIVYAQELDKWLMALYLMDNDYALFSSRDLIHWHEFQRLTVPKEAECPDFYPLKCVETGERLWVFSGASDIYLVGCLSEDGFEPVEEARPYQLGGRSSYAAQTFFGTKDRVIKIAWGTMKAPESEFCSQMMLPAEVTLHKDADGRYRLATNPVSEVETLYERKLVMEAIVYESRPLRHGLGGSACDFTIRIRKNAARIACDFYGFSLTLDGAGNRLILPDREIPLAYAQEGSEDAYTVRIIVDAISLEIFADGGKIYTAAQAYPDFTKDQMEIYPKDTECGEEISVTVAPLIRIW